MRVSGESRDVGDANVVIIRHRNADYGGPSFSSGVGHKPVSPVDAERRKLLVVKHKFTCFRSDHSFLEDLKFARFGTTVSIHRSTISDF